MHLYIVRHGETGLMPNIDTLDLLIVSVPLIHVDFRYGTRSNARFLIDA